MFFKIRLYRISQLQTNADSVYFLKLIFRNCEKTTPYFLSRSEGCILESTFTWMDEKPIDEGDILTFELFNLRKSSIKKISTFQTLMECYSPCRIYYLSDQLENGVDFDFSLYYENYHNLLINRYDRTSLGKQLPASSAQFNCKPLDIIDFAHCFKQPDSSKKLISYGTFNKV